MSERLVEFTRGDLVESIHRGHIAVVDYKGNLLHYMGDPRRKVTFVRSASKPIQAIPILTSGAADHYQFTDRELALFCASHNAEQLHIDTVHSILNKIGLNESALQCGKHLPLYKEAANQLLREGGSPGSVHSNCSGKHSGMLALSQYKGWDVSYYTAPEHPVQKAMLASMAYFAQMETKDIAIGIDGCGVPVFGLPVYNMALAWARLAQPAQLDPAQREAAGRITKAMTKCPMLVAGTGRLCTGLMTEVEQVVAKSGAEGVYCAGILDKGLGIAVKIEDGNGRANGPVVVETLRQLGLLTAKNLVNLRTFHTPQILNHRQDVVGLARPVFTLH